MQEKMIENEKIMLKTKYKPAFILSVIIVILMVLASVGGLFIKDLYQDNFLVTSGWYGNDLVTLLLAVPLLAISLVLSKQGSQRAQLVWLGMLFYTLYNYAFYLFGAAFNSLFLIYVTLFTFSIFALIFGISSLNIKIIGERFRSGTPVKKIGGFMAIVAILLGIFHVSLSLGYVFTGQVPEILINLEQSTNIISALDLSLTVSFGLLGGVLLWKRQPWGYVLAVIWNVKSAVYLTALSAATVRGFQTGASESIIELALWGPVGVGCLISLIILLKNMEF
ncbi:conserved hypothetical protein [Alkaliphilus metalliredigens QYMF]|uniref:Uncharacterized protein n=1 Tax=Alkaliphilus metalliredigens (strain QYMF) TaxID=293826 RepID=A6TVY7_ALKMQ|nr:hypothetical protein [Alkaliphilus metalliredigens]ABR50355.1 conserved hypothetical protein [Alkaliphilus metalliredigens QYMF]